MYLSDIFSLQRDLDKMFNNGFFGTSTFSRGSYPSINIFEADDRLLLKAEVPGLKKEDLSIKLESDVVSLSGEMKREEKDNVRYHRKERTFGGFSRSFKLPYRVDPEKVSAKLENGVLTVALEKDGELKARTISVQ